MEKKKEVNLFDFGDDEPQSVAPSGGASANIMGGGEFQNLTPPHQPFCDFFSFHLSGCIADRVDDDFDDFQTAPPSATLPSTQTFAKPTKSNLFDLLHSTSSGPTSVQSLSQPPAYAAPSSNNNNFGTMSSTPINQQQRSTIPSAAPIQAAKPKPSGGASTFDDLWNTSLSTVSTTASTSGNGAAGKKSLNEMEQQKSVDKLWGSGAGFGGSGSGSGNAGQKQSGGNDLDDLLL